ncbi:carboxymuconolactone decarboxylase family protein [Dasania marina]|uniref:carboxymuconolactone decarboxylase family protein n=1 Tax=Dasania marina TaxID=471499 RepID=UPI0030DBECD0|tara:strand:+ start:3183 stop:3770 length:588 start_codon:yes stop_codon:yes gene_type:complete
MAHLKPLEYSDIEDQDVRQSIEKYEELRGFVPNSIRTMARRPEIVKAFMALNQAVLYDGTVPEATKMLVSLATSLSSGCLYCQSHMTNLSSIYNVSDEKIADLLNYQESDQFSAAEKAALTIAFKAAGVPNKVEEADFTILKQHYDDGQIVEIVATIGLFGYLNRWNDTMATQIEMVPSNTTKRILTDWQEGKHA